MNYSGLEKIGNFFRGFKYSGMSYKTGRPLPTSSYGGSRTDQIRVEIN